MSSLNPSAGKARPIYSVGVKLMAWVLAGVISLGMFFGGTLLLLAMDEGLYQLGNHTMFQSRRVRDIAYDYLQAGLGVCEDYLQANYRYQEEGGQDLLSDSDYWRQSGYRRADYQVFRPEDSNFRIEFRIFGGTVLPISTYAGETFSLKVSEYASIAIYESIDQPYEIELMEDSDYYNATYSSEAEIVDVWAYVYVLDTVRAEDELKEIQAFWQSFVPYQNVLPIALAVGALLEILLITYILCSAGHQRGLSGEDALVQGGLHRIPFDVMTGMLMMILFGMIIAFGYFDRGYLDWLGQQNLAIFWECGVIAVLLEAAFLSMLFYFESMAVRVKKHTLFSGMLIVRLCRWIGRGIRFIFQALPYTWRMVVAVGLLVFFGCLILGASRHYVIGIMLLILYGIILVTFLSLLQVYQRKRQDAVHQMAQGHLDTPILLEGPTKEDRQEVHDLTRLHSNISTAVEEQLKSERMKTELITNVSHDIKTPLTSIINYVDLMKKEGPYSPQQEEYLEVLEKQSVRLKKLIEDLIEASKASTGNLSVNMEQISLGEMVRQLAGEYSERFEKSELTLILNCPSEDIFVMADGRLLSRVFENLFSNALKYSQPGTRVYLDLLQGAGYATVCLRNISKYPLNISEDELMERFVRGDSSRHTEGSGLGLGIALSLTELMQGFFRISIDGDLFKANVSLKKDNA